MSVRENLDGYDLGDVIGVGGMGEVLLAHDRAFGRDVAIKRMRAAAPDPRAIERFLREATIQARLDHPAIPPVHALGRDATGRPYFAMKRLAGTTLYELLRAGDVALQPLLRAFVDVCHAVEYAHRRGIVHRDLKPTNIMLGELGEVYVLDWGLAQLLASPDPTETGAMLGTPGYSSPEQLRDAHGVGPPADVYALGAILFELLTRSRLHPDDTAIDHTITHPAISPIVAAPERAIPPELDALCVEALARAVETRPSAGAMGARVQAFLDGDRDLAQRRALSEAHLAIARRAIADGDRVLAIRAANHALALEPDSAEAATTVMSLVLEPPAELPPPLAQHLRDRELDLMNGQATASSLALATPLLFWPVAILLGITNLAPMLAGTAVIIALVGLVQWEAWSRTARVWPWLVGHALLTAVFCRICGPWVLTPAIAAGLGMTLLGAPVIGQRPLHIFGAILTGYLAPLGLEYAGVLAPTWVITADGKLLAWSAAFAWDGALAVGFLIASNVALIAVLGLFGRALASSRRDAYRQVEIQRWHLAQLIPGSPSR